MKLNYKNNNKYEFKLFILHEQEVNIIAILIVEL